jgi:hypothetical protein
VTVDGADSPFATVGSGATYSGADLPFSGGIGTSGSAAGGNEIGDSDASNSVDGLGGQGTSSVAQPVLTSTGNISSPAAGDTLTTPIICDGGRIKYYRIDPAAPGGRVYLSEGLTYTMVINDIDYSVYSEIECPDPASLTGYGEPIASNATPIIRDPNNSPWFYIGVPTAVSVGGTFTTQSTNRVFCSSGNPTVDTSSSGDLITRGVSNVVEWRLLFKTTTCTQTCGTGGVATDTGCRIEGKLADGSIVYSQYLQSSSCNPKTTGISNTTVTTRTPTSITYDGISMPLGPFGF